MNAIENALRDLARAVKTERLAREENLALDNQETWRVAVDVRLEALAIAVSGETPSDYIDVRAEQAKKLAPLYRASGTF